MEKQVCVFSEGLRIGELGSLERFLNTKFAVSKYLQDFEVSFSRSKFSNLQDVSGSEIIFKKNTFQKKMWVSNKWMLPKIVVPPNHQF